MLTEKGSSRAVSALGRSSSRGFSSGLFSKGKTFIGGSFLRGKGLFFFCRNKFL